MRIAIWTKYVFINFFRSLVVGLQGAILLSLILESKGKGGPGSRICSCQGAPAADASFGGTGSSREPDSVWYARDRPDNLVKHETIDLFMDTLRNESCSVQFDQTGPI